MSWDGTARVWDLRTGTPLAVFAGQGEPAVRGALAPAGDTFATVSWDGKARLWSTEVQDTYVTDLGQIVRLAFDSSSERVLVVGAGARAMILDLADRHEPVRIRSERKAFSSGTFHPSGEHVATTHESGVEIWDARSGKLVRSIRDPQDSFVNVAEFSPDGGRFATTNDAGFVHLWHAETGRLLRSLRVEDAYAIDVDWDPQGKGFCASGISGNAGFWGADDTKSEWQVGSHAYAAHTVNFGPQGKRVLTTGGDGVAKLWERGTGRLLSELGGLGSEVRTADYHRSGELAVVGVREQAVVLDVATGHRVSEYGGHAAEVRAVAFDIGGELLASADYAGFVRIWRMTFESRPPGEIAPFAECHVGKTIENGQIVRVPFDQSRCPDVRVHRIER